MGGTAETCERRAALLTWLANWPGMTAFARETLEVCANLFAMRAETLRRSA